MNTGYVLLMIAGGSGGISLVLTAWRGRHDRATNNTIWRFLGAGLLLYFAALPIQWLSLTILAVTVVGCTATAAITGLTRARERRRFQQLAQETSADLPAKSLKRHPFSPTAVLLMDSTGIMLVMLVMVAIDITITRGAITDQLSNEISIPGFDEPAPALMIPLGIGALATTLGHMLINMFRTT